MPPRYHVELQTPYFERNIDKLEEDQMKRVYVVKEMISQVPSPK